MLLLGSSTLSQAQQQQTMGRLWAVYAADSLKINPEKKDSINCFFNGGYWKITDSLNKMQYSLIGNQTSPARLLLLHSDFLNAAFKLPSMVAYEGTLNNLGQERKSQELALLNRMLGDFKATGQQQQLYGYQAVQYQALFANGESLIIWTTTDIALPGHIAEYPLGTLSKLLKDKPIKGTLLQVVYGKKLHVKLGVEFTQVPSINLEVPPGYELYRLEDISLKKEGGNP